MTAVKIPKPKGIGKGELTAILGVLLLYGGFQLFGITCPILFLTGISCAGCGMTRAWLSLLRLDVAAAVAYHPLFWLPLPALLVFLFRRKLPKLFVRWFLILAAALFLIAYVIRLFDPTDSIVVCVPQHGFFAKGIQWLFHR